MPAAPLDFTPPQEWNAFHFGDAPRWAHYGQDRVDPNDSGADEEEPYWDAAGDLTINDDGNAAIELPTPPPHSAGLPQIIKLKPKSQISMSRPSSPRLIFTSLVRHSSSA